MMLASCCPFEIISLWSSNTCKSFGPDSKISITLSNAIIERSFHVIDIQLFDVSKLGRCLARASGAYWYVECGWKCRFAKEAAKTLEIINTALGRRGTVFLQGYTISVILQVKTSWKRDCYAACYNLCLRKLHLILTEHHLRQPVLQQSLNA